MASTRLPPLNDVEKLSPRVIRILGGNPGKFTLQGTNTYLIGTGPSRILIDTAQGEASWATNLSQVLKSESATVSTALLTHWHHDHVLGVPDLISLCPDVKIYKAKSEIPSMIEVAATDTPSSNPDSGDSNSTDGIHEITDGQVFVTDGARLTAIHCPGHTDDHIAFVLDGADATEASADDGAVFAGDNVLGHGTSVFEDLSLYLASLAAMRAALGSSGILYPAHGEVITNGRAKIDEYVKHRKEREEQVVEILAGEAKDGWTSRELTRVIYADVDEGLLDAAERGVVMILAKLEGDGRARKTDDRWWLARRARF